MASPYITGITALCMIQPGRFKAFWHGIGATNAWSVAGQNYPDTSCFLGEREIIDVSEYLALCGIQTDVTRCASYERAVFDLLHYHIEQKRQVVPNVQSTDIDDVVDFDRVREWIKELEKAGKLAHGQDMQAWLKTGRTWSILDSIGNNDGAE
jgi:muramidase (phage lysozyme)